MRKLSARATREAEQAKRLVAECPPPAGAPTEVTCPGCGKTAPTYYTPEEPLRAQFASLRVVHHRVGHSWCSCSGVEIPSLWCPAVPPPEAWAEKYEWCHVCGKRLPEVFAATAKRKFARQTCSMECLTNEIKARWACCRKAEFTPCVCMYSFTCPEHGETHIGTHE